MPKPKLLPLSAALRVAASLVRWAPTKGITFAYGDKNENGVADVFLEVTLDNGAKIPFGPVDVPGLDLAGAFDKLADVLD